MQKSIEERLTNIESNITRLTKMQDRAFKALLILHKKLSTVSIKSTNQEDSFFALLPLMSVILAVASIIGLSFSLYSVKPHIGFIVFGVVLFVFLIGFAIIYYWQYRSVNRQLRETKKIMSALKDDLAQVLAEWGEQVSDDLVSESSNGTQEPKDSHDRS